MGLSLKFSAMLIFLFQILMFCSEFVHTLVPDAEQVAKKHKLSHFDCGAMTDNTFCALNQVQQCHIAPEKLEILQTTIILYTKLFRKELKATKCRIQHQREKLHCGHINHNSIDDTIAGITNNLVTSPEQCRSFDNGNNISLAYQFLEVEYDTTKPIVIRDGPTSSFKGNHCNGSGCITPDTFLPHMQRTTLNVRISTGKILSNSAQFLTCASQELCCETTSLDPYVVIWDYPDNCVLSVLRTKEVNMVKQEMKEYSISGPDSTTKFVFDV